MKNTIRKIAVACALSLSATSVALSADFATADQIKTAIIGNTDQGGMLSGPGYSQHYLADGTIKGNGFVGKWSMKNDSLCFAYGGESSGCWEAKIDGPLIVWYKDKKIDGAAIMLKGNPNKY